MRYHLIVSFLSCLLALVAAQTTGTTPAPPPAPSPPPAQSQSQPAQPPAQPPAQSQPAPSQSQPAQAPSQQPQTGAPPPSSPTPAATSNPTGTATGSSPTGTASTPSTVSGGGGSGGGGGTATRSARSGSSNPPDVLLRIPNLSVGKIELDVDNIRADVNLAAQIAQLVELNVGVQVGIEKVNITIAGVHAQLELQIRLGHLVDIVNRTLQSLDLNPLLINVLDTITDVVEHTVGAIDGLLGSVVQGGTRLNFIIDNLGNIVQEVITDAGNILSSIVGNYQQNMTYTGQSKDLGNGLTQKTYNYSPLGALVNIVLNGLNQIVSATVVKGGATQPGSSTSSVNTAQPTQPPSSQQPAPSQPAPTGS